MKIVSGRGKSGWVFIAAGAMLAAVLACGPTSPPQPSAPRPDPPDFQPNEEKEIVTEEPSEPEPVCGDGMCEAGEVCPQDCAEEELDFGGGGTATPTPVPTEVVTEEPMEEDTSLPPSVIDELVWTTTGGGGGDRPDACDEGDVAFWITTWGGLSVFSLQHPYRNLDPELGVYGLDYTILQCNLPENTEVFVSIRLPDDEVISGTTFVDSNGLLNVTWTSIPGEPAGRYVVQVAADELHLGAELYFDISRARYPIVNVVCELLGGPADHVLLTGFEAGERVAVIMYHAIGQTADDEALMGIHSYQYVRMDSDGMAFAEMPKVDGLIVAVGDDPEFAWDDPGGPGPMPADGYDAAECNRLRGS